jgi:hypothetical protein
MIQRDYVQTYAEYSDAALCDLHANRDTLIEAAAAALDLELRKRGFDPAHLPVVSSRAYEAIGGVVVTDRAIRLPNLCTLCLKPSPSKTRQIASLDAEAHYRLFYTKWTRRVYVFRLCEACGNGEDSGVRITNFPTTEHDIFYFSNDEYQQRFLKANE